jgi:hypothetical protein
MSTLHVYSPSAYVPDGPLPDRAVLWVLPGTELSFELRDGPCRLPGDWALQCSTISSGPTHLRRGRRYWQRCGAGAPGAHTCEVVWTLPDGTETARFELTLCLVDRAPLPPFRPEHLTPSLLSWVAPLLGRGATDPLATVVRHLIRHDAYRYEPLSLRQSTAMTVFVGGVPGRLHLPLVAELLRGLPADDHVRLNCVGTARLLWAVGRLLGIPTQLAGLETIHVTDATRGCGGRWGGLPRLAHHFFVVVGSRVYDAALEVAVDDHPTAPVGQDYVPRLVAGLSATAYLRRLDRRYQHRFPLYDRPVPDFVPKADNPQLAFGEVCWVADRPRAEAVAVLARFDRPVGALAARVRPGIDLLAATGGAFPRLACRRAGQVFLVTPPRRTKAIREAEADLPFVSSFGDGGALTEMGSWAAEVWP